jgi:hypothetical protein
MCPGRVWQHLSPRRTDLASESTFEGHAKARQILEDAEHLITVWNKRQSKRIPMLFSPTLPPATQKRVALCVVFVRNRELFAQEPVGINTDEPFTDELTELVTRLAIGGLLHASAAA